jgi:hypothetical protein
MNRWSGRATPENSALFAALVLAAFDFGAYGETASGILLLLRRPASAAGLVWLRERTLVENLAVALLGRRAACQGSAAKPAAWLLLVE